VDFVRDQLEAIVATGAPGAVVVADTPDGRVEAAAGVADVRTGEAVTIDHAGGGVVSTPMAIATMLRAQLRVSSSPIGFEPRCCAPSSLTGRRATATALVSAR
jgi:hypothetical protein